MGFLPELPGGTLPVVPEPPCGPRGGEPAPRSWRGRRPLRPSGSESTGGVELPLISSRNSSMVATRRSTVLSRGSAASNVVHVLTLPDGRNAPDQDVDSEHERIATAFENVVNALTQAFAAPQPTPRGGPLLSPRHGSQFFDDPDMEGSLQSSLKSPRSPRFAELVTTGDDFGSDSRRSVRGTVKQRRFRLTRAGSVAASRSQMTPEFMAQYSEAGNESPRTPAWSPCEAATLVHTAEQRRFQNARRNFLVRLMNSGQTAKAAREVHRRGRYPCRNQQVLQSAMKAMVAQRRELAESRQLLQETVDPPGVLPSLGLSEGMRHRLRVTLADSSIPQFDEDNLEPNSSPRFMGRRGKAIRFAFSDVTQDGV